MRQETLKIKKEVKIGAKTIKDALLSLKNSLEGCLRCSFHVSRLVLSIALPLQVE